MQVKKIWAPILKIPLKFSKSCHRQTARVRAMKFYELKNMHFVHMHTKFQLSSFIRSRDIADLLLYTKTAFFWKTGIFEKNTPKSKLAISPLPIKLKSLNLVWTCIKHILFFSWNYIALRQTVWRWHGFEIFRWIFKIGAQIFLTCTCHHHDLNNFEYLYADFQALFRKSRVCSISCINRLDYEEKVRTNGESKNFEQVHY